MKPKARLLPLSVLVLGLPLGLALGACVIVVDEDGLSFGGDRWRGPQGSGVMLVETREVDAFDTVTLACAGDVRVAVGSSQSVTVHCDDNLVEHVTTEVEHGRLIIGTHGSPRFNRGLEVVITTPHLEAATVEGSGDMVVTGVEAGTFVAALAGSGDLRASGSAERIEASVSGSGDLRLQNLAASSAGVSISGSGTVRVHARQHLKASISGSGDVIYAGDPKREVSVSGSGSVRHD